MSRVEDDAAGGDGAGGHDAGAGGVRDNAAAARDRLDAGVARLTAASAGRADPAVCNALGAALIALGRFDEAIVRLTEAVALRPDFADALGNLGNALAARGRREEAMVQYLRVLALRPGDPGARNNLAGVLMSLGRVKDALAHYRVVVAAQPGHAPAWLNVGNALDAAGRPAEAALAYERAVAVRGDFAPGHSNLGIVLRKLGRPGDAEASYRRALACAPDYAPAHRNLGNLLVALNRNEEAVACYERAIATGPPDAGLLSDTGTAYHALGQPRDAYRCYRRAHALDPRNTAIMLNFANCKRFGEGDERLADMEALAADATLAERDRVPLQFALGKAFDDLGQPERAFRHLHDGNELRRRAIAYDEAATLEQFERIKAVFTPALLASRCGSGDPAALPVFVVGMPRSGTTLIEQILASHPGVFGAGERLDLDAVVDGLRDASGAGFPEAVATMRGAKLRAAGSRYLERLRAAAPDHERIVDKLPMNFRFLGLIRLALPHATIIHVRRDPLDTCFSCYSLLFTGTHHYAYDLAELGRYYRAYEGLMEHWRAVLPPGAMLEVRYESVVEDLEGEVRRILRHCRLPFDRRCLRFWETPRAVLTASATQVRAPVSRGSIGRSRRYRGMLQPLVEALGDDREVGGEVR